MRRFAGIDPGRTHTGVALIGEKGELLWIQRLSGKDEAALGRVLEEKLIGVEIAIEMTWAWGGGLQDYNRRKGAMENRALGEFLRGWLARSGLNVVGVTPQSWKGNTPKNVIQARLFAQYPSLGGLASPGSSDQLDAMGIALWLRKSRLNKPG